jgi:phage gpG-like protein
MVVQASIRVGNYATIVGQLKGKLSTMATKAGNAVQGAGIDCEAGAKQRCPVGTPESTGIKGYAGGRLRSSIKYTKINQFSCKCGTNVKYAKPVEFGHVTRSGSFVPAQPYMFPSYVETRKNLLEELNSLVHK